MPKQPVGYVKEQQKLEQKDAVLVLFYLEDASLNKATPRIQSNFFAPNKAPLQIVIIFSSALIRAFMVQLF